MYGFGDDQNPYSETVDLIEDLVVEYITELVSVPCCGLTTVSLCPLQTKKAMNTLLWSYNSHSLSSSDQEDNEHVIVVLQQSLFVLFRPRRQ